MKALLTVTHSLYRVLILTAKAYTEALLKDESAPNSYFLQPISGPHRDG